MVWQVVACVLATAGLILFCWCLIGSFLLPVAGRNLTAVYQAGRDASDLEQTVRSFSWLRGTGMIEMPLKIVDCGMDVETRRLAERLARAHPYIQIVGKEQRQEQEETERGATGDDPWQCGCGDLPK